MEKYRIEKDIPVPSKSKTGLTNALKSMAVGDSFTARVSERASIFNVAQRVGVKVITRKSAENELRVWRAA